MENRDLTNLRDIPRPICFAGPDDEDTLGTDGPVEAAVVNEIVVRLVRPEEVGEWDRLMIQHHYLKSATMVGEQLRYVAEYRGQWMALIGWAAGAYHLKGRDGWIGWDANQRRARLHLVANNARFCRLGPRAYPNLASRALALNLGGCRPTGRRSTGIRLWRWRVSWMSNCFGGRRTRRQGGGRWERRPSTGGCGRISVRRMIGPSSCTCGNW